MNRTTVILVSAITAFVTAVIVSLAFLFFMPPQAGGIQQIAELLIRPTQTQDIIEPTITPIPTPKPRIKESDVSLLTLETESTEFFEEKSQCRKTYSEFYGDSVAYYHERSPCTARISFNRDGSAEKSIELRRYDKTTREMRIVEKMSWKSKITTEQFNGLAGFIVNSNMFVTLPEYVTVTIVDTIITRHHRDL